MCFSATASFSAAAAIGSIGILALWNANPKRSFRVVPLALFPTLFAAQQLVEGLLWLDLRQPESGMWRAILIHAFLVIAEVLWPILAPLATCFIEPRVGRRRLMLLCVFVGLFTSGYLLWQMIAYPYLAFIRSGHIVYLNYHDLPYGIDLFYILATTISLLISSHKTVSLFGAIILIGYALAYASYQHAYVSMWCFFAAVASVVVYRCVREIREAQPMPRAAHCT